MGSRKHKTTVKNSIRGIGLIEVALFVVAFGMLQIGAIKFYHFYMNNEHTQTTAENLTQAQDALNSYFQRNRHFPCPAPQTAALDTQRYGKEATAGCAAGAPADGTTQVAGRNGNMVRIGALPVRELGLADNADVDGWGNRLVYAVTEAYAKPVAMTAMDQGAITIQDSQGHDVTSAAGIVIFTVMAPGPNEIGAYRSNGKVAMNCNTSGPGGGTNEMTWTNCHNPNATFRSTTLKKYDMGTQSFTNSLAFRAGTASVLPVAGICGTANGVAVAVAPATNLCNKGNATAVAGAGPWTWTCTGLNGGANSPGCTAPQIPVPIAGVCGAANGTTVAAAPAGASLCTAGNATAVAGAGPWTWSCTGINGGAPSPGCSANKTPVPVNGICGLANAVAVLVKPAANLCNAGTATVVAGVGPWTWTCNGLSGGSPSPACSAPKIPPVNGTCGAANGIAVASAPAAGLCTLGTATAVAGAGPWTWTCNGLNGGSPSPACSAPKLPAINGVCGTANGVTTSVAPAASLCTTGSASVITTAPGSFSWSCNGSGGGTTSACTAPSCVADSIGDVMILEDQSPMAFDSVDPWTAQPLGNAVTQDVLRIGMDYIAQKLSLNISNKIGYMTYASNAGAIAGSFINTLTPNAYKNIFDPKVRALLGLGGQSPLYDKMITAAKAVGNGTAARPNMVVYLGDGFEQNGISPTTRDDMVQTIAQNYPFIKFVIVDYSTTGKAQALLQPSTVAGVTRQLNGKWIWVSSLGSIANYVTTIFSIGMTPGITATNMCPVPPSVPVPAAAATLGSWLGRGGAEGVFGNIQLGGFFPFNRTGWFPVLDGPADYSLRSGAFGVDIYNQEYAMNWSGSWIAPCNCSYQMLVVTNDTNLGDWGVWFDSPGFNADGGNVPYAGAGNYNTWLLSNPKATMWTAPTGNKITAIAPGAAPTTGFMGNPVPSTLITNGAAAGYTYAATGTTVQGQKYQVGVFYAASNITNQPVMPPGQPNPLSGPAYVGNVMQVWIKPTAPITAPGYNTWQPLVLDAP